MLQYYINWLGKSWSLLQLYPGQIHKLAAFYLCKVKTTPLMVFPKTTSKTSKSCSKVNLIILLLDFLCNFTKTQLLKFSLIFFTFLSPITYTNCWSTALYYFQFCFTFVSFKNYCFILSPSYLERNWTWKLFWIPCLIFKIISAHSLSTYHSPYITLTDCS